MKEWNKVLLGSIGVLALLFVADRVVGALWEKTYKHSRYGIFHRQEYCLHKSDDNILILGSSRAAHHYVPKIFTDSLRELLQWWKRWTVHLLRIWYSVSIHRKKINFSNCYLWSYATGCGGIKRCYVFIRCGSWQTSAELRRVWGDRFINKTERLERGSKALLQDLSLQFEVGIADKMQLHCRNWR